ncbi:DUF4365 domain-containing protein (plasmid) [Enterobacter kobei]|uniref:DUF4365 domain-containing protein n=1 Tax=Enterobacter kobei TaxID=208224 RepID=UPI0028D0555A|nr:DUF4365 domain-containing protein [Enterobacter kobei]WNP36871.1 DUF4365 domain-containing protein [Enterobacter kobei]
MKNLPKDSDAQRIGRQANRALKSKLPGSWIDTELSGDSDYGIDYQIQLTDPEGNVQFSFYLQLKGTTSPDYDKEKAYIKHPLRSSTLNNYEEQEPLVMLAVVDLSININQPANCPIYYIWLDEEWFSDNKAKIKGQKSLSINIPTNQIIHNELNVYDLYAGRITKKVALSRLGKSIEPYTENLANTLGTLADTISEKPIFLKAAENSGDEPWIENPAGHISTLLKECHDGLTFNSIDKSQQLIDSLENIINTFNKNELAEFHYIKAMMASLQGNEEKAISELFKACKISQKDRYKLGYLEMKLKIQGVEGFDELEEITENLSITNFRSAFLKAKLMALMGRVQEATNLLEEYHPNKPAARLIILTIADDPSLLDDALQEINIESLENPRDKLNFYLCAARREYFKAYDNNIDYNKVMSIHGSASANLDHMRLAHDYCTRAWECLRLLGYPSDFVLLLDIAPLTYNFFNKLSELFTHFDKILDERPTHPDLIKVYSRLLFNVRDNEKVINLLEKIPTLLSVEDKGVLFASYYYIGRNDLALNIFKEIEDELLNSRIENAPFLFCTASEVAKSLYERELAEKYREIVISRYSGEAILAVSDFVESVRADGGVDIHNKLEVLYREYHRLNKPIIIAENLLSYLNESSLRHAEIIVELSFNVRNYHELDEPTFIKLVKSHITLNTPADALKVIDEYTSTGKALDQIWKLLKAVALQNTGKLGLAYEEIKDTLQNKNVSNLNLELYVNLCLQFGLLDDVENALTRLINTAKKREDKINYLCKLITVYSHSPHYNNKRVHAIKNLGELVNPDDPIEEGRYLTFALFSPGDKSLENETTAIRLRLSRYTERFPDSIVLRQGKVDVNASAEDIAESLNALSGTTQEQKNLWKTNERAIRNGSLPAPFVMLNQLLSSSTNIFMSWDLAKSSPEHKIEFKLRHSQMSDNFVFESKVNVASRIILEDTSLILLSEINLLDVFLENVNEVHIFNSTFRRVNQEHRSLLHHNKHYIQSNIHASINKFKRKLTFINDDHCDCISFLKDNPFGAEDILLTDDLNLLVLARTISSSFVFGNVFNVIELLYTKGLIEEEKRFDTLEKICHLGVYQPCMHVSLFASSFIYFTSKAPKEDYSDTKFKAIFNGVFSSLRDTGEVISLFFKFILEILSLENYIFYPKTLLSMIRGLLLRHPCLDLDVFIAKCFIFMSLNTPINYHSSVLLQSSRHKNFYDVYYDMLSNLDNRPFSTIDAITLAVEQLYSLPDEKKGQALHHLQAAFVPYTYEHSLVNEIFYKKGISI